MAVLSHPVIDAMVAVEGKTFRGGYFVHRKAFLVGLPIPKFSDESARSVVEYVREIHDHVRGPRAETDSERASAMRSRIAWVRGEVELLVGEALGIPPDDSAQAG